MNMRKNYIETLSEWVKKRETTRTKRDIQKIAFLAVRADVKAAIEAGYALKTIWEHMTETGKITYRYETFLKHVNRRSKTIQVNETLCTKTGKKIIPTKEETPNKFSGFKFNPVPKKEDLI